MWTITLRDLQFRGRQFGIAVAGAALVFALALELTGISAGFRTEAKDVVGAMDADAWVVQRGSTGPFTSQEALSPEVVERVGRSPGIDDVQPLVDFGTVVHGVGDKEKQVNVLGHDIGGLGDPVWGGSGGGPSGQVVVDERLGADTGDTLRIGNRRFRVSDVVEGRTYFGGVPIVWMTLQDSRDLGFDGQPLASAILARGDTSNLPPGFVALTNDQVREDMLTPLEGATQVIDTLRLLMWVVAALIIGAVTYLSALERVRDFAVLKAVGGASRDLAFSLAIQAVLASLMAAVLGGALAYALKPAFPVPVTITTSALIALPLIAIAVGVVASIAALRRAVRVDPALAFAG